MPADLSGAFVDIGVHQDGLVHVSALANKFVKDPHEVVKPGQVVKVLDVEVKRQRISLTMCLDEASASIRTPTEGAVGTARTPRDRRPPIPHSAPERQPQPAGTMAMALALAQTSDDPGSLLYT
jgi:uncharacterized protein